LLAGGVAKGETIQEVQGYPGLGAVGRRGVKANYLAGSLEAREVGVFQVEQRRGNGKGEDLPRLEGSVWIYMEIGAAQANVPQVSLTLERGVGVGHAGMIGYREGHRNAVKSSSFPGGGHELISNFLEQNSKTH